LGIGPGDEVIVPAMTFIATANVVEHVGATPVFVDVDPDTLLVTPALVSAAVTARTRAVIPSISTDRWSTWRGCAGRWRIASTLP
jgi:UDP-4-amino-4-deoxy-L-arabinose-oxoglutarate aminotransferase